jgi:hypothetical protein
MRTRNRGSGRGFARQGKFTDARSEVANAQAPILFVSSTSEDLKPHREAARDAAVAADFRLRISGCG